MSDAVRSVTIARPYDTQDQTHVATWLGLDGDDTGTPIKMSDWTVRSVQFGGTFDSGTVVIEGSNDGVTYFTLNDLQGSAISKTSAALEGIAELTAYIRPKVTGGGGSCSINVYLLLGGNR